MGALALQTAITHRHPDTGAPTPPLPGQARAHADPAEGRCYAGGLGAGKTAFGAVEAWKLAARSPKRNGLLAAPFYSTLGSVVLEAFLRARPEGLEVRDRSSADKRYLELPWGARVYYRTAENPASFEGIEVGWAWGDEFRYWSREAFEKFVGRVRGGALPDGGPPRWWGTTTPAMNWLHDEFLTGKRGRSLVTARTDENPYVGAAYVESIRASYSPKLQRQMLGGEFILLEGAVYEEFDPAWHYIPWTWDERLRSILFWDFGHQVGFVGLAQEVDYIAAAKWNLANPGARKLKTGDLVVARQWVQRNSSTEATAIMLRDSKIRVDEVDCDPAGDASQTAFGVGDVTVLQRYGFTNIRFQTDPRLRFIPHGVSLVRGRLRNAKNETSLWLASDLQHDQDPAGLTRALASYRYEEVRDGHPISDRPKKDGVSDHACDALRYLVLNQASGEDHVRQYQVR